LLLLRNRVGIASKLHDVSFNRPDKLKIDVVMVVLMSAATILPGQLDAISFDTVDGSDRGAVLADDLHVFLDIRHEFLLWPLDLQILEWAGVPVQPARASKPICKSRSSAAAHFGKVRCLTYAFQSAHTHSRVQAPRAKPVSKKARSGGRERGGVQVPANEHRRDKILKAISFDRTNGIGFQ
jgi:hypothetical protein